MRKIINNKIRDILIHRKVYLLAALLAFLAGLPLLGGGLFLDDYAQRILFLTRANISPFEFYDMASPHTQAQVQSGMMQWWMHPAARLIFFRPIATWLMQLDYALWPESAPLMHLHSVIWYALAVASAGLVYRRLMPVPMAAGLAVIMFALDAGHGAATSWIANRNVLVAMTGSMFALLCHEREQWRWQLLGCALFALTLACAEAAIAMTAYFFAYEVFLSRRRWWVRIARLVPYGLIVLLYLAFWHRYGYGSVGPGFYIDPASDPKAFLQALIFRAPSLLVGHLLTIPVELFAYLEQTLWLFSLIIVLAIGAGLMKLLWPLLRSSELARFYALGMCIAVIPVCGVQPVSRSLVYVSFGGIGLLGLWFERFLSGQIIFTRVAAVCTGILLVLHFAISPLMFVFSGEACRLMDKYVDTRTLHLPDESGSNRHLLLISTLNYGMNISYPLGRDEALSLGPNPSRPKPSITKVRALTSGIGDFELSRPEENTLIVRRTEGFTGLRKGLYGFQKGEHVKLDDVDITVREINAEHAATEIEYRFSPGVLADYEVFAWVGANFVPAQLPAVGAKTIVTLMPRS